jgi:hypothetical protein
MRILLFNLLISSVLTGLIWFVQIVHYPIFLKISPPIFINFQAAHTSTTGSLVAPLMVVEIILSVVLLTISFDTQTQKIAVWTAFALVLLIWIITFFVSVPIHNQLITNGFDEHVIRKLINTNWIRTIAWTLRTGILTYLVYHFLSNQPRL